MSTYRHEYPGYQVANHDQDGDCDELEDDEGGTCKRVDVGTGVDSHDEKALAQGEEDIDQCSDEKIYEFVDHGL